MPTTQPPTQIHHNPPSPNSSPLGQTTALNTSSSRFTLSIPLLGRPKVPLGNVLGKEKEQGSLLYFCSIIFINPSSFPLNHRFLTHID